MWLETITVRSAAVDALEPEIRQLLKELPNRSQGDSAGVYIRCPSKTDLAIHLFRSQGRPQPSAEGLQLADALRSFGSVDHAMWRPAHD